MENPELYAVASALQKRDAALVLSQYLGRFNWTQQDDILDFGCGTGDITRHLSDLFPKFATLTGVDISKEMISYAKKVHQVHDSRLLFQQIDLMNAIQPNQIFPRGFDKIFSFYCLHWIKDHKRLLESMFQITKPEGTILLSFLASNPIFTMYQRMAERKEWAKYMTDVDEYVPAYQDSSTPEEMFAGICRSVGYEVIECTATEMSFAFQNANHVKNAVAAVNPFLRRIPKNLQERYLLDSCIELQKLKTPSADGSTTARYRLMIAYARRPAE